MRIFFSACGVNSVRVRAGSNEQADRRNNMKLDETQRSKVAAWIADGLKLAEIQKRLDSELGLRLTYMDVRFLVDDLKLTPKDPEPPKPAPPATELAKAPAPTEPAAPLSPPPSTPGGTVSVIVDQIARPGAMVSGKVTFSDGNKADWHLDQTGRLGLVTQVPGYRPAAGDVQQFQAALETELSKLGF